jgi:hypothetical protein
MKRLCGLLASMKVMIFFLALLLMGACESEGRRRVNRESLRFRTTDDAELYFKNLRRIDYDYQELAAAKLDIFRHKKRRQEADYPLFTVALVVNWRYDEAYILLEANEALGDERPLMIEWRDSLQGLGGQYVLESNNKMEQLRFASQLYEGMQAGRQFYIEQPQGMQPFLQQPADRRVFRISMMDYYRLTGNVK